MVWGDRREEPGARRLKLLPEAEPFPLTLMSWCAGQFHENLG